MLGIRCAGDIDLAISKLPPSEADVMELQFVRRPSLNLSGGLRCGFLLVSFTEWILCSPSFRNAEINSTINWEKSPSLRDVRIDSPSFRDAGIDSTINMDMGYGSSLAVANEIFFSECVDAAALKALSLDDVYSFGIDAAKAPSLGISSFGFDRCSVVSTVVATLLAALIGTLGDTTIFD